MSAEVLSGPLMRSGPTVTTTHRSFAVNDALYLGMGISLFVLAGLFVLGLKGREERRP